jgi:two-component system, chemotaxis family, chemotaxis protein CheY
MKVRNDIVSAINSKRPEGVNSTEKSYRVLIADDSTTMRKIVSQHLKTEAYEICGEAANGQEAVDLYKELSPDVVTLDINMPVMDGLDALRAIIAFDKNARIVMLTSEGQKETVVDALKIGARGYIVKPPNKAVVCEKVRQAIQD